MDCSRLLRSVVMTFGWGPLIATSLHRVEGRKEARTQVCNLFIYQARLSLAW